MIMPDGKEYIQRIRTMTNDLILVPNTEYWRKILKELQDPKIKFKEK